MNKIQRQFEIRHSIFGFYLIKGAYWITVNQIKSIIKLYIVTPFNSLKSWGIVVIHIQYVYYKGVSLGPYNSKALVSCTKLTLEYAKSYKSINKIQKIFLWRARF